MINTTHGRVIYGLMDKREDCEAFLLTLRSMVMEAKLDKLSE
jgi:hypothetical protein